MSASPREAFGRIGDLIGGAQADGIGVGAVSDAIGSRLIVDERYHPHGGAASSAQERIHL